MPPQQPQTTDEMPVPISITICGDGGCGKSSITLRLVRSQWVSEYDPTIEDSYSITRRIDGITYHLSLTDTAGQEEYRGMWASSNLGADAFLLVYDITSRDSLYALEYFNELIDMEAEVRLDNADRARRAGLPIAPPTSAPFSQLSASGYGFSSRTVAPVKMVAGNKCDLAEGREVPAAVGLEWARRRGCGFMETSARLEVNIEETFRMIVRRVVERRRLAAAGIVDNTDLDRRGVTKPLSPLVAPSAAASASAALGSALDDEKAFDQARGPGLRGPSLNHGDRPGRAGDGFWRKLRCW